MSKLIIVCGLSGSGKTSIVNELSKKLKIFCLQKDSIKEDLYESLNCSTLEESKRLGPISIKLLFKLAKEAIENDVDIIIEGVFNFEEDIELFRQWKNEYDLDVYCIICSIDEQERMMRFEKRLRHKAHHDDERLRNNHFFNANFNYDLMPDEKIKIITNKPKEELVNEIIKKLNL